MLSDVVARVNVCELPGAGLTLSHAPGTTTSARCRGLQRRTSVDESYSTINVALGLAENVSAIVEAVLTMTNSSDGQWRDVIVSTRDHLCAAIAAEENR